MTTRSTDDLALNELKAGQYDPLAYGGCRLDGDMAGDTFPECPSAPRHVKAFLESQRYLDSTPTLNLASFVTTMVEPECTELMVDALRVNQVDAEEYLSTTQLHARCVRQLADLFHVPPPPAGEEPTGFSTIGSSEAIQISLLAMKTNWRDARKAAGLDTSKPNLVCPSTVHVCHEKSCVFFDVEMRAVPVRAEDDMQVQVEAMMAAADENTIGCVSILGSTYTGHFQDCAALDAAVEAFNAAHRPAPHPRLGIHIDGASGGFVAPFAFPDCLADFRLKNVVSLNASGHKYGQALAGIGWCMFRDAACLPKTLCFVDKYLGAEQVTATFNFSKSAAQLVGQAYMFLRLGRSGYTQVIGDCLRVSDALAVGIEATGAFTIVSARAPTPRVPLVAFSLKPEKRALGYDEFDIADRLRERGWVVPAYPLAPGAESVTVLRVVCRSDFSTALARSLLGDLRDALAKMDAHASVEAAQVDSAVKAARKAERVSMAWSSAAKQAATAAVTRQAAGAPTSEERRRSLDRLTTAQRHGGVC